MVIWVLYELRFFELFWDWYDPRLTISVYACLVLGFVLELILSGRRKKVCHLLLLTVRGRHGDV